LLTDSIYGLTIAALLLERAQLATRTFCSVAGTTDEGGAKETPQGKAVVGAQTSASHCTSDATAEVPAAVAAAATVDVLGI
jgi:hypothetical protein